LNTDLKPDSNGLRYPTMKEIVLTQIRDDLLSGKLAPEQVLNINELAHQYNVSNTPIREALTYLESMGLVEKINNRSIRVSKYLSDEVHEVYYVRAALSGLAARLAAKNMDPDAKRHLLELVEQSKDFLERNDQAAFLENNREFHNLMLQHIKTPLIRNISEQFYIITRRYREMGMMVRSEQQLIEEHEMIAQAVYEGDEDKAEMCARMHYLWTIQFLENKNLT